MCTLWEVGIRDYPPYPRVSWPLGSRDKGLSALSTGVLASGKSGSGTIRLIHGCPGLWEVGIRDYPPYPRVSWPLGSRDQGLSALSTGVLASGKSGSGTIRLIHGCPGLWEVGIRDYPPYPRVSWPVGSRDQGLSALSTGVLACGKSGSGTIRLIHGCPGLWEVGIRDYPPYPRVSWPVGSRDQGLSALSTGVLACGKSGSGTIRLIHGCPGLWEVGIRDYPPYPRVSWPLGSRDKGLSALSTGVLASGKSG